MEVKKLFPPNYQKIKEAFPDCEKQKAIFCYGEIVYNPFNAIVTRDLEIHEAVHSKQQGKEPEVWWDKYIQEPKFRLEQEIEAYGVQAYFIKKHFPVRVYENILGRIAQALSGELYGNIIDYHKAHSELRHFIKKV